jgi:hypothetical protein
MAKGLMTEKEIRDLREKAAKARQFAKYAAGDDRLVANLESYAQQLESDAEKLEGTKEEGAKETAPPLSPQAMEATHEPAANESMAALKADDQKEPGDQ